MIEGTTVRLRCLEQEDLPLVARWRNQKEIRRFFFDKRLLSVSGQRQWFDRYLQDDTQQLFIAEHTGDGRQVGMIGLFRIDYTSRKAEIGSTIVGDTALWGQGIAEAMVRLLLEYAFVDLNLHRIYAYAIDYNAGSVRVKQKCGFHLEGTLRQDHYADGTYRDVHVLGLLREEWERNRLPSTEAPG